jgi:hypothetical protein
MKACDRDFVNDCALTLEQDGHYAMASVLRQIASEEEEGGEP